LDGRDQVAVHNSHLNAVFSLISVGKHYALNLEKTPQFLVPRSEFGETIPPLKYLDSAWRNTIASENGHNRVFGRILQTQIRQVHLQDISIKKHPPKLRNTRSHIDKQII
jgi:hypothetical protein